MSESPEWQSDSRLILLVEDDPGDAALVIRLLREGSGRRYRLERAETLALARAFLAEQQPAVVLLDLSLPDSHGLDTVRAVHALVPAVPLVVLTGHDDPDFALSTLEVGAQDYLVKGSFTGDGLLRAVRHAVVRAGLEARHRKLEEQLRQAQKMESVGTLAGGIAHDFNNLLTAIIGYGQISLLNQSADEALRGNLEQILAAAKRGAQLTQSLLLFSRKQDSDRRPVELNAVIGRVDRFLKRVIGEDIDFQVELAAEPLPLLADAHQLEQVMVNLATNARDAMPGGGFFRISTGRVELDREFVATHGEGKPGPYALLTVTDSGEGMSGETRARIFEPFFTTKKVGQGTGLGLAMAYGIVRQHDGFFNVYSERDKGTTFRIYLPLLAEAVPEAAGGEGESEEYPPGGRETILMAEDDPAIRNLTRSVLERFGYTVLEAEDGEQAVARFLENRECIDLLLFDLIMPRLNGKEALDEIRRLAPKVKCIFASGYAPELLRRKVSLDQETPMIYKPMSIKDLLSKIRQVLDS